MLGMTRWKASEALAPCAVGSVSRSTIFSCSITEPGHPWQTRSGSASSCGERTWTKWMSSPSISVMKLGTELLMAAGVADRLLARGVGPAGDVGDDGGPVPAEQAADDLAQTARPVVGEVGQRGANVAAEADVLVLASAPERRTGVLRSM